MALKPGQAITKKSESYWSVQHDQVALLVGIGILTHEQIARQFGLHKATVGKIAQDPRAQAIIEATRQRLRERLIQGVEAELDLSTQLAVRAVKKTLEAQINPLHPAKANQDRVAIKLLQGKGFLKTDLQGQQTGFMVAPDQFDKLMKAFERSDRAAEIDPFAGVVDGIFTIEDGSQPDLFDDSEAEDVEPLHQVLSPKVDVAKAGLGVGASAPQVAIPEAREPEEAGPQDHQDAARGLTPEIKKQARIIVDDWLKEQYGLATGTDGDSR